MGRDAFFTTGLEKRFAFATQASSDIQEFGGVDVTTQADIDYGHYRHAWNFARDGEAILAKLTEMVDPEKTEFLPNFAEFPKSLEGTHAVDNWLHDRRRRLYEWIGSDLYTYTLGCLIYHQLLYCPDLEARYHPDW